MPSPMLKGFLGILGPVPDSPEDPDEVLWDSSAPSSEGSDEVSVFGLVSSNCEGVPCCCPVDSLDGFGDSRSVSYTHLTLPTKA